MNKKMNTQQIEFPTEDSLSIRAGSVNFPLESVIVKGEVDGTGVKWTVEQTFKNPLDAPAEAEYTMPLPVGGAVVGVTMTIGNRVIEAEILERAEAHTQYEEAKEQGYTAGLVEQNRAEIFVTSIGNIHPGESITVTITIHDAATIDGTEAFLRFPTLLKKRFITADVPDAAHIDPPRVTGTSPVAARIEIEYKDEIEGLVCDTVDDAQITSTSVVIDGFALDRDVSLRWTVPSAISTAKWVADSDNSEVGTVEVSIRIPRGSIPKRTQRRAISIMLDRSGSMGGHYMIWARAIVKNLLSTLDKDDLVHVVAFDNKMQILQTTEHGFAEMTRENKKSLLQELSHINAQGGTDLPGAIAVSGAALETLEDREDYADLDRIVVLVTDGAYGDEALAVRQRELELRGARVIAVAIGEDANGYLEALVGTGTCVYIQAEHLVDEVSAKVVSRVKKTAFLGARLHGSQVTEQAPHRAPDIYEELLTTLSGRMPRPQEGDSIDVITNEGVLTTIKIVISEDETTTTRWASAMVKSHDYNVMAGAADAVETEKEIVRLSTKYKVLSKYTAWLAVDRSRTTDQVITRKLIQPIFEDLRIPLMSSSNNYLMSYEPYALNINFALRTSGRASTPTDITWLIETLREEVDTLPLDFEALRSTIKMLIYELDIAVTLPDYKRITSKALNLLHKMSEAIDAADESEVHQRILVLLPELDRYQAKVNLQMLKPFDRWDI